MRNSSYILEGIFSNKKIRRRYNTLEELKKELNKLYYSFKLMTCRITQGREVIDYVDLIED